MNDVEDIAVLLIQDPIALAIHVYHMTKWTEEGRDKMSWEQKIPLIAANFNITILQVKRALDYLDKAGID